MKPSDVSVIVNARDDAGSIRRCLESVRGLGATVVVDSFCKEDVLQIAREFPVVIYRRPGTSSADQRNWGMSRVSSKWVLVLDGNESVDEVLVQEIAKADENLAAGFRVRRANEYLGKVMRGGAAANDRPICLFDRSRGRFVQEGLTTEVRLDGTAGNLGGTVHRVWFRDVHDHFQTVNLETTLEARDFVERGGRLPVFHMLVRPPLRFLRTYIGQGSFKDGARGLVFCWISSFAAFIKYAKAWEYRRNRRRSARNDGSEQE
jgi:glycosyltransferase involved in cell wall biosynthesis